MAETTRACTKCQRELGLDCFYRDKRAKGGIRNSCKECHCAQVKDRYARKRDEIRAYQQVYRDRNKATLLAYAARYRAANADKVHADMDRYRADPKNQQVARERAREFRLANPERRTEYQRRRMARRHAVPVRNVTPQLLALKFAYWGDRCWMCNVAGVLHADHVKPLAKGGAHILANLRPACRSCNASKFDRWPFPTGRRVDPAEGPRPGPTARPGPRPATGIP